MLLFDILFLLVGFALLIWAADIFIIGSTAIATYAKISPLIIGIVIVGFATSAPEYSVSILSAINASAELSFGNILGSNIINITLGLGIPFLFIPLRVTYTPPRAGLFCLIFATALTTLLIYDYHLGILDAILLLLLFIAILYLSIRTSRTKYQKEQSIKPSISKAKAFTWIVLGLILLIASSQLLIYSATSIASFLGLSELVIGLTIIALGTSLPEIASSIIAILKGEDEMALGNIIGSNLFNILFALGSVALVNPIDIAPISLIRDASMLLLITILLYILMISKPTMKTSIKGAILITAYIIYTAILIITEAIT